MSYNKKAPTPCLEDYCHNSSVFQGRCQTHRTLPWQGSTRKQRLPNDWNTRRNIILSRSRICYLCGGDGADTVDHIIPNDDHSLENLGAVHDRVEPHCHRYKSSKEGNDSQRLKK